MTTSMTEPIGRDWTTDEFVASHEASATATDVNGHLAHIEIADIEASLVPHLAAATAELALLAGVSWRFSADDPPVALLRMMARVAIMHPDVGGPHTARLYEQLRRRRMT